MKRKGWIGVALMMVVAWGWAVMGGCTETWVIHDGSPEAQLENSMRADSIERAGQVPVKADIPVWH